MFGLGRKSFALVKQREVFDALMFSLLRKEVIQPHLPIRLPCYDLALLTNHTLDAFPPYGLEESVSGAVNSGGLTGGVYKTRERIHRAVADARLLAIPAS